MSRRQRDEDDDDRVRVLDSRGRPVTGRTAYERAALAEARRMRAAGEPVGRVDPLAAAAALEVDRIARTVAHLRGVLAEVDAGHLHADPAMLRRLEAAAVALEAIRDEPAPVDLDQLP